MAAVKSFDRPVEIEGLWCAIQNEGAETPAAADRLIAGTGESGVEVEGSHFLLEVLAGVLYLIVGARLLRLARRTGETPERLLGWVFMLTGVSYLSYEIPIVFPNEILITPFSFAGRLLYAIGMLPLLFFAKRVFRRDEGWAHGIVWGAAILMGLGIGVSMIRGDWNGFSLSNPWFWSEWVGYTLPYIWVGAEAFIQHRNARRRLRIGLCDPILCNRFRLWKFVAVVQVAGSFAVLPMYSAYEMYHMVTWGSDALLGICELFSVGLVWLVFFPPIVYRRWILGVAPAVELEEA